MLHVICIDICYTVYAYFVCCFYQFCLSWHYIYELAFKYLGFIGVIFMVLSTCVLWGYTLVFLRFVEPGDILYLDILHVFLLHVSHFSI